jgi:hypothetical protein
MNKHSNTVPGIDFPTIPNAAPKTWRKSIKNIHTNLRSSKFESLLIVFIITQPKMYVRLYGGTDAAVPINFWANVV